VCFLTKVCGETGLFLLDNFAVISIPGKTEYPQISLIIGVIGFALSTIGEVVDIPYGRHDILAFAYQRQSFSQYASYLSSCGSRSRYLAFSFRSLWNVFSFTPRRWQAIFSVIPEPRR
jgi:hypothetical protein